MENNKKLTVKVSKANIMKKLQDGLDDNGWRIIGTGGTKVKFLKPLIEYLQSKGIEVK